MNFTLVYACVHEDTCLIGLALLVLRGVWMGRRHYGRRWSALLGVSGCSHASITILAQHICFTKGHVLLSKWVAVYPLKKYYVSGGCRIATLPNALGSSMPAGAAWRITVRSRVNRRVALVVVVRSGLVLEMYDMGHMEITPAQGVLSF